jgi:beta-phosphoglucomutase-like phosphatase (HAD superfamily)
MTLSASDVLLIFDCDGVLVDSEPIAARVLHQVLSELGLEISLAESTARFTGLSMATCAAVAESMLGMPLPPDFAQEVDRRSIEAFRSSLLPVRGIDQALGQSNLPRCVASSGSHARVRASLAITGVDRWFPDERIFSSDDVARGKPAPDLFRHAAVRMGYLAERCIVIEDSVPGVQAAVSAGMAVFGYAERSEPRALRSAGATVFNRMSELATLIARPISR